MKIKIEGNLYLESDAFQYMLTRYIKLKSGKNKGEEIPQNVGYYTSIHSALQALLKMKINESTATSIKELREDIKKIEEWIKSMFEVELKDGEKYSV